MATATPKLKISTTTIEAMEKDLKGSNGKKPGRKNPLYDEIIEKAMKLDDKTIFVELSIPQRTGLLGKLKKMDLLVSRKAPNRPLQAKFKIVDRDANGKPKTVRIYLLKNDSYKE
ncbi:MAG: hypothetical protein SH809_11195 [Rhodothermales bacterium]|nr:hypothetical protein [Rhodothermales bacterium]